jgi:hypothetical protein
MRFLQKVEDFVNMLEVFIIFLSLLQLHCNKKKINIIFEGNFIQPYFRSLFFNDPYLLQQAKLKKTDKSLYIKWVVVTKKNQNYKENYCQS